MSRERFELVDELFRVAIRLPAGDRAAYLDEVCGDDAALREELTALLSEDAQAHGALDVAVFGQDAAGAASPVVRAADTATTDDQANWMLSKGSEIGPYKLLEQLGEGGFGVVYMAEQSEPVLRRVALKIIKLGMDTRQVIARFEAERQALALMDHPHIATVLDAGTTSQGRPYFAMELCGGTPITDFCRTHALSLDARLELASQVCRAVEHAHQKGVIHRDIKPGNVLVEQRDGRPFARVIDFGIAKAIDVRLTERTFFTEHRQMIGTPEYMSPEQAEGLPDVDTRTDVYALGVLLYELLTGRTPHDGAKLRCAAWGEMQRIIREVEPAPPSTRHTRVAGKNDDAESGGVPTPRGELDWVVMKALRKERDQRYQSAGELAADLTRLRDGEAVTAAPPSRRYRVRTFVRRNRALVIGTAAVVTILAAGVVGTSLGLMSAIEQRTRADAAALDAEERARDLDLVVRFQAEQISGVDPVGLGTRLRASVVDGLPDGVSDDVPQAIDEVNFTDVALRSLRDDFLQRSLDAANTEFSEQPLVRAQLLQSIADAARDLGFYEFADSPQLEAFTIRERELGIESPETIDSMHRRVLLLKNLSRYEELEPLARRSAELHRSIVGESTDTFNAIGVHGAVLRGLERLDEALPLYREAYEGHLQVGGPDAPATLTALNNMGFILRALGRMDESEQAFRDTLEGRQRVLGPNTSGTLSSMINLGGALRAAGKFDEAEPLYLAALAGHEQLHGSDHSRTLTSTGNVGVFYVSAGRYDEAEEYLRRAVEGNLRVVGPTAVTTLIYSVNLGHALARSGKLDEARTILEDARRLATESLGSDSPTVIRSELGLAVVAREGGDSDAAIAMLETLLNRAVAIGGADWVFAREVQRELDRSRED